MRFLTVLAILVLLGLAALFAWIRLSPVDPGVWHADPLGVATGRDRFVVAPEGGDTAGPLLQLSPPEALAALDEVARATPRTRVLAGSVEEGRITYITRSALWGFPDFTTIAALPAEGGSRLAIFARQGIGDYDWGVNAKRVQAWLDALGE